MSADAGELLQSWLAAVLETPGLTALRDPLEARGMLLEDSLRAVDVIAGFEGPIVDVGSGGGAPGIPLAVALPDREVTLLEAAQRKADFLRRWEAELPNVRVVWGRAEDQRPDQFGVAVAKALAPPAVSAEWCLALVRPGGAAVLWTGPNADIQRVARVAMELGGAPPEEHEGLLVIRKVAPTPPGFPRRPGVAKKRPLA